MIFNDRKKIFSLLLFSSIVLIFVYFRIVPIINQTVPYTYDQDRDFLKVEEIVRYKNPTFIGPTTGIMGIYHGAWWYYLLSIPYIIFSGNPIGFSFFMFVFSLSQAVLFYLFLKRDFNFITALFFLIILSGSSYFITSSFFVISSMLVLPFLLLLFYSSYQFFKTEKALYQFFIFLSLGFVFEAEVPFGLFLIPSYLITIVISGKFKQFIGRKKNLLYSLVGLLIPLSLRIFFEIKHSFIQTKAAIDFLLKDKLYNPHSLVDNFKDRLNLFWGYYNSLFDQKILGVFFLILFVLIIIYGFSKLEKLKKEFFKFISILLIMLFLTSLAYRDNFWPNYFEGLPYFYLVLLTIVFYSLSKFNISLINRKIIQGSLLVFLIFLLLFKFYNNVKASGKGVALGLRGHLKVVNFLYQENKNKDFCVRIYTPPVIPYTYNYLFSYYSRIRHFNNPTSDYKNNKCWYIIEDDPYKFRIEKWRKENIPSAAKTILTKKVTDDVRIELWQDQLK